MEDTFDLPTTNEIVRDLLEDFDVIGTWQHAASVRRRPYSKQFAENVRAAVVASTLRLASLDYAKRRYCDKEQEAEKGTLPVDTCIDAYQFAKSHLEDLITSLETEGKPEPSVGVFGASIVLERLLVSFFCTHLMYEMGYRNEGHAISRLILEQIAWAFAARETEDMGIIKSIRTTSAISKHKRFAPEAGALYGFLSKKTHIDYSSHWEFLRIQNGRNVIVHGHDMIYEYGLVILRLGDLFGLVWEASQFPYIVSPQAVEEREGTLIPKWNRPYLQRMQEHLTKIKRAVQKADDAAKKD